MGKRIDGFQDPDLHASAETLARAEADWLAFSKLHPFVEVKEVPTFTDHRDFGDEDGGFEFRPSGW